MVKARGRVQRLGARLQMRARRRHGDGPALRLPMQPIGLDIGDKPARARGRIVDVCSDVQADPARGRIVTELRGMEI